MLVSRLSRVLRAARTFLPGNSAVSVANECPTMATVPMDPKKVARCRAIAGQIADDVQRYIDAHTTVGVERTILRAYGAEGVDDQGVPLVNTAIERYREAGLLGRGIAFYLGRSLLSGAANVQDAAERLAFGPDLDRAESGPG